MYIMQKEVILQSSLPKYYTVRQKDIVPIINYSSVLDTVYFNLDILYIYYRDIYYISVFLLLVNLVSTKVFRNFFMFYNKIKIQYMV